MKQILLLLCAVVLGCGSAESHSAEIDDGVYAAKVAEPYKAPEEVCKPGYARAPAADGWVKCLPYGAIVTLYYSDAACTLPVIAASDQTEVTMSGNVYKIGPTLEGPVYAKHPDCVEMPAEDVQAQFEALDFTLHTLDLISKS